MSIKLGVNTIITRKSVDVALLAQRAEALGFESFWVAEEPFMPVNSTSRYPGSPDGVIPEIFSEIADPLIVLARASALTTRIKLGTGICLVPLHNPLLLAKEIATLDHLSGGRFLFGIGAGWLKEQAEIMGSNFELRWLQTREAIQAMKEVWTKDEAEFHGQLYDFPPVRSFPKPAQKPHPPIHIGAMAGDVLKWVIEWGDGWFPPTRVTLEQVKVGRATLNKLAVAAGRDPNSIEITIIGRAADPEEIRKWEEAGANRATIRLPTTEGDGAFDQMEEIARRVIAR
jgi:probable F420-dependent oxidoreductase